MRCLTLRTHGMEQCEGLGPARRGRRRLLLPTGGYGLEHHEGPRSRPGVVARFDQVAGPLEDHYGQVIQWSATILGRS